MGSIRIDFEVGGYRGGIGISTFDGLKLWRFKITKKPKRYNVGNRKYAYRFEIGPFWGYAEPYFRILSDRRKAKIEAQKVPNFLVKPICDFVLKR